MTLNIDSPIFLVGAERSGTTLLRLMLDNHPAIIWQSEFEFAVDFISDQGTWPELNTYYQELNKERVFIDTGFNIDERLSYPDLVKSFLKQKATRQPKKNIIGATCHRHFDRLLHIWPQARFIHILRDPRDVARSNIGMGWAGNVWNGVDRWIEAEKTWEKLVKKTPNKSRFDFFYEDLIAQPQQVLNDICEFLNVDYHPDMLCYSKSSTYSAPDKSLVYQWKDKLSKQQVQLVEYKAGKLLEQRGFSPSGLEKTSPGWLEQKKLCLQNYFFKKIFRIKRYGFCLIITNFLARKFRISQLEFWSLRKLHALERHTLK